MAMKKITTDEQRSLRSSVYINSFKRAVEELVYNSLDAEASSIAVRVCIPEYLIQVIDNGVGILEDNFNLLGQKYATNKHVDVATLKSAPGKYGFCGLSLASVVDISQSVQISSKHHSSEKTLLKIFSNGKENKICETIDRPSKGTTVEIKGFMYNMNIQRKLIDPINELQDIKKALQQLSLVHCNVSVSLRDDSKNEIIFQVNKNRDIYKTLQSLFNVKEEEMQELQVEKNQYKIKAFIGKSVSEKHRFAWIYLNGKFITNSILHKKINENLVKVLWVNKNDKVKNKRSIFEGEKICIDINIPFYFIFITCPNYDFDMFNTSDMSLVEFKEWAAIDKLIEKFVQFYCSSTHSLPKKENKLETKSKEENVDTRQKVKEIIDKILNNKSKEPRNSQLRNGVKGKRLKRKQRKTRKDLVMQNCSNKIANCINSCKSGKSCKLSFVKKTKISSRKKPSILDVIKKNVIQKVIIKNVKTPKISQVKKVNKNNKYTMDPLIRKFEEETNSVKSKCRQLNQFVDNLIQNSVNNSISLQKDVKEVAIQNSMKTIPNVSVINEYGNESNQIVVKTSYDLITTITHLGNEAQNTFYSNKSTLNSQYTKKIKNKLTEENFETNAATYNSHNYEECQTKKKKVNHFISDKSCSNFVLNKQNIISTSYINNANRNKTNLSQIKNRNKTKISNNCLSRYDHVNDFSYSIDVNESQELNDYKNIIYTSNRYNMTCIKDSEMKYNVMRLFTDNYTFNNTETFFGNTYTLSDLKNISQLFGSQFNRTYTMQVFNAISSSNCQEIYDNYGTFENIKNDTLLNDTLALEDVLSVNKNNSDIVPYDFCEAVLTGEFEDLENEFKNSFVIYRNNTPLSNSKIIKVNDNNDTEDSNKTNLKKINCKFESRSQVKCINESVNAKVQEIESKSLTRSNSGQLKNNKEVYENIFPESNTFHLKSRHHFMPKGMSPITKNKIPHNSISLCDEACYEEVVYEKFANDVLLNSEIFEPTIQNIKKHLPSAVRNTNSYIQTHSDLMFDAQTLKRTEVLGQVDCKFIATVTHVTSSQTRKLSKYITLFDQHAVDERIRLEHNLKGYIKDGKWDSVRIDPLVLTFNEDDYLYIRNHKEKFSQFGLQWSLTENEMVVNAIPKAILGHNHRQVESIVIAVKKLILEQIAAIKFLKGNVTSYPKSIMELVFSEACRYAVKFGDKLTKNDCKSMINALAYCKTPFQCAHGRPVMAVITELSNNIPKYTINLDKIKKFKMRLK